MEPDTAPPPSATDALGTQGTHGALAALVFITVMGCGAWQLIGASRSIEPGKIPQSGADFWQGRSTGALEKQLDLHLPMRGTLITVANGLRYRLTHGANEQVRLGSDDWLFLSDELRYYPDAERNLAARVTLLQRASQRLARDGVKLVVALVPDKARVAARQLPTHTLPGYTRTRYDDALRALREQGVAVVDLLQPLAAAQKTQGDVYYRTDTHWNQRGAQIAAQAIAVSIKSMQLGLQPSAFSTETGAAPHERAGDLLRLMGLEAAPNFLRPLPDLESPQTTRQTSTEAVAGLFDDVAMPVVLTGTSYSMRGNFHGHLQQALGAKVLNSAQDGAGFLQATSAYLNNEAYRSAKPRVLIWEVPERFLPGELGAEKVWLKSRP